MGWDRNELNKDSKGGSEMMMDGLYERIDPELIDHFQIIPSRVRELQNDKIRIYWLHDLPQDPEAAHLREESSRNRFHQLVYCGNWQMAQYQGILGIPHDGRSCVIETAIDPIPYVAKSKDEVRLIYTSTPQRGLSILIPVFEELAKKYDNIVLDVFSSFKIYGWGDADRQFEDLFERCRNHPKINYHGFAENSVVREHLQRAHILAYPSIWPECNSRSVIEGMSAGAVCVHPNFGGLPDTGGGMSAMYNWDNDVNRHANLFMEVLDKTINIVNSDEVQNYLSFVKMYADTRYNWNKFTAQWNGLLNQLLVNYQGQDLSIQPQKEYYQFKV